MFLKDHFIFLRVQNCTCLEVDASSYNDAVFCYEIYFDFFSRCLLFFCSNSLYIQVD